MRGRAGRKNRPDRHDIPYAEQTVRTLLGCALAAALVPAVAADDEKRDLPDGKKLVGMWQPLEAKKGVTTTLAFAADGKLTLTVEPEAGKAVSVTGAYRLDGAKLKIKLEGKKAEAEVAVVRLSDEILETEDSKGKRETFARVAAKL